MAGDLHPQIAKMLYRPPHLGARSAQLLRNTRAADDDGSVVAKQAHNPAQASVGGVITVSVDASWRQARDKTIMREWGGK